MDVGNAADSPSLAVEAATQDSAKTAPATEPRGCAPNNEHMPGVLRDGPEHHAAWGIQSVHVIQT